MSEAQRQAIPGVIAFVSERGSDKDIWLVRPSGAETRLTQGIEDEFPAGFRPDGGALLTIATREIDGQHREQLRLLPLAGTAEPVLLHAPRGRARSPSFAPDGSFFVAESDARGFSDLVRMAPGVAPVYLTQSPRGSFEPSVSPDGRRVAFVSSRDGDPELYVMDISAAAAVPDTGARRLTESPREDGVPSWSPDGQWLMFLSRRETHRVRVYVMRVPATGPGVDVRAISGAAALGDERDAAWSPDGHTIAFTGRLANRETRIYKVALAGGPAVPLTDGRHRADQPAWSPDSKYLVYVEDRAGEADLFLMRADGTGKTQLTQAKGADWLPRWSVESP